MLAQLTALQSVHWYLRYGHFCEKEMAKLHQISKLKHAILHCQITATHVVMFSTADSTSICPLVPEIWAFL